MKHMFVIAKGVACLAVLVCLSAVAAAQKADFSGVWVLDQNRSEGLPPSMKQTMTVTQSGDKIDVEYMISSEQGELTIKSSYTLDGKESEVTLPGPMRDITAKGKQTAQWSDDGHGFESQDEGTFDTPYGPATIRTTRKWQLSYEGKTLTVLISREGLMPQKSKRIFVRKES